MNLHFALTTKINIKIEDNITKVLNSSDSKICSKHNNEKKNVSVVVFIVCIIKILVNFETIKI